MTTINDPTGDQVGSGDNDIRRVTLSHTTGNVSIDISGDGYGADGYTVFLDVTPAGKGPDFAVYYETYLSEYAEIRTTTKDWEAGKRVRCRVRTGGGGADGVAAGFSFDRACLKTGGQLPARIRVNVQANDFEQVEPGDSAPGRRQWSRWVGSGR
ncbi:hypothetical protein C7S10_09570 [Nocardioides currus]|uniref:Uncharacterized protein n=1 Tax=Nocardioides currus TaxID=2133958 RepID=A0A2R7YZE7_9ACTN|nr:hypothetical protein C7S10_09570 [Nocardioides currus]